MKIRTGHVSNSSTLSVIVQTKPTIFDSKGTVLTLDAEKIELLKKCRFVPMIMGNPFIKDLRPLDSDWDNIEGDTEDGTYLGYWITCNHDFVMQFLVANDIPFKAAVHYSDYLYSYDPRDKEIYILRNFGIDYHHNPKDLEKELKEGEVEPLRKISKEKYLKGYDEEESLRMMGVEGGLT